MSPQIHCRFMQKNCAIGLVDKQKCIQLNSKQVQNMSTPLRLCTRSKRKNGLLKLKKFIGWYNMILFAIYLLKLIFTSSQFFQIKFGKCFTSSSIIIIYFTKHAVFFYLIIVNNPAYFLAHVFATCLSRLNSVITYIK